MKVFYNTGFKGFYPVGTCAIVVADSKEQAKVLLEEAILKENLGQQDIPLDEIVEVDTDQASAEILLNGDY